MLRKTRDYQAVKAAIDGFPRCALAQLPTPLQRLDKLSRRLGINLFVKRDDLTGLGLGGNKVRKLEFVIANALAEGADTLVTWAGLQSNWCRQVAAAACTQGLKSVLVLFRRSQVIETFDGNLLIDAIYGADIHFVDSDGLNIMELEDVRSVLDSILEGERKHGRKPYLAPIGASVPGGSMKRPLGAIAYIDGLLELLLQAETELPTIDAIVFATGSGSMQAGINVAVKVLSPKTKVVGISVSQAADRMRSRVQAIADLTLPLLNEVGKGTTVSANEVIVFDQYIGPGYGILDQPTADAIRLVAETEGLLLDPVYTGKAFVGLLDQVRRGYFRPGENVVFLHSGGWPALFANKEALMRHLSQQPKVGVPDHASR